MGGHPQNLIQFYSGISSFDTELNELVNKQVKEATDVFLINIMSRQNHLETITLWCNFFV